MGGDLVLKSWGLRLMAMISMVSFFFEARAIRFHHSRHKKVIGNIEAKPQPKVGETLKNKAGVYLLPTIKTKG